jgi:hypothetical protein
MLMILTETKSILLTKNNMQNAFGLMITLEHLG